MPVPHAAVAAGGPQWARRAVLYTVYLGLVRVLSGIRVGREKDASAPRHARRHFTFRWGPCGGQRRSTLCSTLHPASCAAIGAHGMVFS